MSDKVKDRIEKEAHSLANNYTGDHTYNSGVFTGYVAGATAERPKAWNEAIDEAIKFFKNQWQEQAIAFTASTHYIPYVDLLKELEKLKHKQS